MPRKLANPPIVEHIIEIKWRSSGQGDDLTNLFEEYEIGLGQLFAYYKHKNYRRQSILSFPKQAINVLPPGVVWDRFQPDVNSNDGNIVTYPLVQYGPGVASIHVDRTNYSWPTVRQNAIELFQQLSLIHENLQDRMTQITSRTIDVFESDNTKRFLTEMLKFEIVNPIGEMSILNQLKSSTSLRQVWKLVDSNSEIRFVVGDGTAGGINGLITDINIASMSQDVNQKQFDAILDYQHKITGDIFFKMLSKELRDGLGYTD